jgi:transcriptional regulator with XRE-family HTH domain
MLVRQVHIASCWVCLSSINVCEMQHDFEADRESDVQEVEAGFGERVKEARVKAGWTQRDLAAKLGLDASAISRLEKGTRAIRLGEAAHIAIALGSDLGYLVYGPSLEIVLASYQAGANSGVRETRSAAMGMAAHFNMLVDLLEHHPQLLDRLADDEGAVPKSVDEYLEQVVHGLKTIYRLPDADDRVINTNPVRVRQIMAAIEATVENVISDVPFPEQDQHRIGRGLAQLIPTEEDDASEA